MLITSIIINIVFLIWIIVLMNKISVLRKENAKYLGKDNNYNDLIRLAKEKLNHSTEMETIKYLRTEKGLSMIEAKKIVDSIKNG